MCQAATSWPPATRARRAWHVLRRRDHRHLFGVLRCHRRRPMSTRLPATSRSPSASGTGYTVGTPSSSASVTVNDDDAPVGQRSADRHARRFRDTPQVDQTLTEGTSGITLSQTRRTGVSYGLTSCAHAWTGRLGQRLRRARPTRAPRRWLRPLLPARSIQGATRSFTVNAGNDVDELTSTATGHGHRRRQAPAYTVGDTGLGFASLTVGDGTTDAPVASRSRRGPAPASPRARAPRSSRSALSGSDHRRLGGSTYTARSIRWRHDRFGQRQSAR